MKKNEFLKLLSLVAVLLCTTAGSAKEYTWVKDKQVSSQDILNNSLSSRMIRATEAQALETIRNIMSRDLNMTLSKYNKSDRKQAAQTTFATVLPEAITGQGSMEMADKDYIFMLEIQMKAVGNQTRISAKAQPMYRVLETQGEDGKNTVEVKIKAEPGQAAVMGPIWVMPIEGQAGDYNTSPLPDAAQRCANLVRYFMLRLDERTQSSPR